jgi:O-antigen/teichoic acid export membrane protein
LLRSAGQFSAATLFAQAAGLARTYLAARLLGPTVYGTWLGLRLIVDYGNHLHLGAISGMHREVPLSRGRADQHEVESARETAFAFTLYTGLFGMMACAAAAFFVRDALERSILLAIAVVLLVNQLRAYYVTLLKADNRFREASVGSGLGSAAALGSVPFIYFFGMAGFVWGLVGMLCVETGYLVWCAGVPSPRLSAPMLKRLLAFGVPTTMIAFAEVLLSSVDRTVILEKLNAEQLGYYSVAFIGATFLVGVATVPTAVLYPRLSEQFGRTGRASELLRYVAEPLRLAGVGFAALIGAMVLALPALVHLFLPKYVVGIRAAQITIIGNYGVAVAGIACNAFLALDRQRLYLAIMLLSSGASYVLARLMVYVAPGLNAVAVGCSAGMFIFLLLAIFGACYVMEQRLAASARLAAAALAPIVYAGAAVAGIEYLLSSFTRLVEGSVARGACAELAFAVAMLPWVARAARSTFRDDSIKG